MGEATRVSFQLNRKLTASFVNDVLDFLLKNGVGFFSYDPIEKRAFKNFERVPCFSYNKKEHILDDRGKNLKRKNAVMEIVKKGGSLSLLADKAFNFDVFFNKNSQKQSLEVALVVFAPSQLLEEKNKKIFKSIVEKLSQFLEG